MAKMKIDISKWGKMTEAERESDFVKQLFKITYKNGYWMGVGVTALVCWFGYLGFELYDIYEDEIKTFVKKAREKIKQH